MTRETVVAAVGNFGRGIANTPTVFLDHIARLPSTNFRIFVTLGCVVWTTAKYMTSTTWEPSLEWLGFLATMSGLDLAQFGVKRRTNGKGEVADSGTGP